MNSIDRKALRRRMILLLAGALLAALSAVSLAGCSGGGSGGAPNGASNGGSGSVFGNNIAQVQLEGNSSTITNHCGTVDLREPIPAAGSFSVTGLYPSNVATRAVYSGQIAGNTMTLTVTNQSTGAVIEQLTLMRGVSGQFEVGTCP